ncbi:MAG: HD-GYP domain-containing protein, partial [Pseudomonas sp.]
FAELKRSYVVSTQVFATMLQQRLPRERQTNEAVISLVKAWAERRDMPPAERENLTMAAALYNIGKVTWNDDLLSKPADLLYKEYRQIYRQYPEIGEGFLMALEPLQDAARLIRQHMERWDGLGFPDKLQGAAIPLGAQMLRLAVEFVELQAGIVLDHKVNRDNALAWVKRYSGKLYDPVLADEFIGFCRQQLSDPDAPHYDELLLDTRRASPGMSLSRDLYAANGLLLLNAGKLLTRTLLDKLTSFEVTEGVRYPLYVQAPSAPESQLPGKEKSL